jgi:hypothetical protein
MIASGGNDNKVILWDERKLTAPLAKINKVTFYTYIF